MADLNDLMWFNLSGGMSDTQIVLDFLREVPDNLRTIFDDESFRLLLDKDYNQYGIDSSAFFDALKEAEIVMHQSLDRTHGLLEKDPNYEPTFVNQLNQVGYTGASLQLKANVLNKLWTDVKNGLNAIGEAVINFADFRIKPAVKRFLTFLNSCLGSLSHVIAGADAIKEIKEIGESLIDIHH